jgi:hypothetical protein
VESFYYFRIKLFSGPVIKFQRGVFVRFAFTIDTITSHRIEGVCHGKDPGA